MHLLTYTMISTQQRIAGFVRRDDRGAAMVEYALLVALIAIVALVALNAIGDQISENFSDVDTTIQAT